jgi:hypothetical protein
LRKLIASLLGILLVLPCFATQTAGTTLVSVSPGAVDDSIGVVVFSVGAPQRHRTNVAYLLVYPQGSMETVRRMPMVPIDRFSGRSDFADHYGRVHVMQLPPGSYYFSTELMSARTRVRPTFLFEVRPGEVTYVGEVFMESGSGPRSFRIRDEFDRDIVIAREKTLAIQGRDVARRLLQPGPEQTFGR